MDLVLLQTRVKAFLLEAGALLLVGVTATLASPQFADIVTSHFGTSIWGSFLLLAVNGLVKHVANVSALHTSAELGANGESKAVILV